MNEKNQEFEPNRSTVVYSRNPESGSSRMVSLFEIPGSRFISGRILATKSALNMGMETFNIKQLTTINNYPKLSALTGYCLIAAKR